MRLILILYLVYINCSCSVHAQFDFFDLLFGDYGGGNRSDLNQLCLASGSDMQGTCVDPEDCEGSGMAMGSGNCSSSSLCCCVGGGSCGGNGSTLVSYFTSPQYPASFSGNPQLCTFQVCRFNSSYCKIRVRFTSDSMLAPPNITCVDDAFTIENAPGSFCGKLESYNNHVDVEFKTGVDILKIQALIDQTKAFPGRKWKATITQIPCATPPRLRRNLVGIPATSDMKIIQNNSKIRQIYRKPRQIDSGCLQTYYDTRGIITSYNFRGSRHLNAPVDWDHFVDENHYTEWKELEPYVETDAISRQAADMIDISYGICIKLQDGFCSVSIQKNTLFHVGAKNITAMNMTCDLDLPYLVIPNDGTTDRFCGKDTFPEVVRARVKPIVIYVLSHAKKPMMFKFPGFDFKYRQEPC